MMDSGNDLMALKRKPANDDNMIPLINIVFLLLIFFMVAGHIRAMPDAEIQLPQANLDDEPSATQVRLEMNQHGEIALNGKAIEQTELVAQLQALAQVFESEEDETTAKPEPVQADSHMGTQSGLIVALFVDQRATAQQLTELLRPLRQMKVLDLQLHTELMPEDQVAGASL
ncbi:MAG: ExbD/TolR family protein [Oceanobacter sp.]